jgi:hypothetical protein
MRDRRTLTLSLSLALPFAALAVLVDGCSVDPLDQRDDAVKCAGTGIPAIACATGPTVPVCAVDATGRWRWTITCPGQLDGGVMTGGAGTTGVGRGGDGGGGSGGSSGMAGGGMAGGAGTGGAVACASTQSCAAGEVCTTEDGDCKLPPGCGGDLACPAVCYGVCRPAVIETPCLSTADCEKDEICTTVLGVCKAPPGCNNPNVGCPAVCYGECRKATEGGACDVDSDCRLEADYCTGCDCRALAKGERVPACPGPGVQCFADPCGRLTARCVNGKCAAAP